MTDRYRIIKTHFEKRASYRKQRPSCTSSLNVSYRPSIGALNAGCWSHSAGPENLPRPGHYLSKREARQRITLPKISLLEHRP